MAEKEFKLTTKEREVLANLTKSGNRNSREFVRAFILLALDKGKKHEEIKEFYNVSRITIWRVKNKYHEFGVEEAIKEEPRPGQPKKYDDTDNAEIIAMACSNAPDGRSRWTIRLLEQKLNDNGIMINRESIRLLLKKTNVSLG